MIQIRVHASKVLCQIWPDFPSIFTTAVISNPGDLWNLSSALLSSQLLRQHLDLNDSTDSHRDRIHFWTLPLWMAWRRKGEKLPSGPFCPCSVLLHVMFALTDVWQKWKVCWMNERHCLCHQSSFRSTNFLRLHSNHTQCHKLHFYHLNKKWFLGLYICLISKINFLCGKIYRKIGMTLVSSVLVVTQFLP